MASRRNFIKITTIGASLSTFYLLISQGKDILNELPTLNKLPLSIAGRTFRYFDIAQSIQMMQKLNIHFVSIKDFHLPLNSLQEKIDQVLQQYKNRGIRIYAEGLFI